MFCGGYLLVYSTLVVLLMLPPLAFSETWGQVNKQLNETFHGVIGTPFGNGKDPRFFYKILEARPSADPFNLNKYTGALEVISNGFDYDRGPNFRSYSIIIQVTSQSDKTMNDTIPVSIQILDVNDKPPYFVNEPKALLATLAPDAIVGAFIFQLNASDPDTTSVIRYSVIDFAAKGRFTIDPTSGVIRVGRMGSLSSVPGTRYELEVEARDINAEIDEPQIARSRLSVVVGNAPPQFYEPNMHVSFLEEQPVDTLVFTVRAKSFQGHSLNYALMGSSVSMSSFRIHPTTGEIRVARFLDYDNKTEPRLFNFTLLVTESVPNGLTSSTELMISLVDVNDNPPIFQLSDYVIEGISEDTPIERLLFTFNATDRDSGNNSQIAYDIIQDTEVAFGHDNDISTFSVLKHSGQLKPAVHLDYDKKLNRSYWFRVLATDQNENSSRTGTARVRVLITNINDENPEFLISNKTTSAHGVGFYANLMENAPVRENIIVGVVRADDPDGDQVTYAIVGVATIPAQQHAGGSPFSIDPVTGFVRQVRPLAAGVSTYVLNVSAEDDGACCAERSQRHVNFTKFIVNIKDVNNNRPRLNCSACNGTAIKEGFYANHTICKLAATDSDLGDNGVIHYSLRGTDLFSVDPLTGNVYIINANLDREQMDGRYVLYLTGIAEDQGRPKLSDYCSFQIAIDDFNDNAPMLDIPREYNFYVSSLSPGTVVALLSAVDKDSGINGQVSFFVNPSSVLVNYFSISSTPENNSGVVKIIGEAADNLRRLAARRRNTITLPLQLRDHGVPELITNASIRIQISDGGLEHRPFWNESLSTVQMKINENTRAGHIIANLTAEVPGNVDSPIRYLIPTRDQLLAFTRRIPFWFETESTDSKSVRVYLYRPVNAEMQSRYVFTVRATTPCISCRSGVGMSSESQLSIDRLINITIEDANDEVPFFLNTDPDNNCYYGSFPENPSHTGILVATAKADDLDITAPNNVIDRYELRFTDRDDQGKFVIDPRTGEIRTNSTDFNFEKKQFYSIRIVAFDGAASPLRVDGGPNVGETFLRIQILDVNDNPPHFNSSSYEVHIQEHAPRGTLVKQVIATDPDQWDVLTYEIIAGDPNGTFIVDGDGIYVNNPMKLDADVVKTFHLEYRAFDNRFSASTNVIIKVDNVADRPPVFSQSVYTTPPIVENDTYQSKSIVSVSATSSEGSNVSYVLAGKSSHYFRIAGNEISLARPLDHDELTGGHAVYEINVEAFDKEGRKSGLFSSAIVRVPVGDVNDNWPVFMQDSLVGTVKESVTQVQTVGKIEGIDGDSGINGIVYYNLSSASHSTRFKLDERSGLLSTVFGVEFTMVESPIVLQVVATDGGSPRLSTTGSFTVHVVDINNHAPKCSAPVQNIEMFEDAASDVPIALVAASDNDDPNTPNGELLFSLDDDSQQYFSLFKSGSTAFIYPIIGSVDYEKLSAVQRTRDPRLTITVSVADLGQPSMPKASCQVVVTVRNSNDNAPTFQPPSGSIIISENIGLTTQVYRNFTVSDADPSSGKFVFRISERSNWRRQFAIEPSSQHTQRPIITVVEPLDRETIPSYRLEVLAIDEASPELTGTATLTIELTDVNDSPPHLAPLESLAVVPERQQIDPSWVVAVLKAEDNDTAENNGEGFGFELDCSTSDICQTFQLDYDRIHSEARLRVKANAKPFVRAVKSLYIVPVEVWDNAFNGAKSHASLSYRDEVKVVVGGGNYYAQSAFHKDVEVIFYTEWLRETEMKWIAVGRPFARDDDDWDMANKKFEILTNNSAIAFSPSIGQVVLQKANVQPGTYDLAVRIIDVALNVEVLSTMTITVKVLPQGILSLTHSVRIADLTPYDIIGSKYTGRSVRRKREAVSPMSSSRLSRFRRSIAFLLDVDVKNVMILSISDVLPVKSWRADGPRDQATDIFFAISDGRGYPSSEFSKEVVASKLLLKQKQIESDTGMRIVAVPGDACSPDPLISCPNSGSCFSVSQFRRSEPLLVDANATAFIGVDLVMAPSCEACPAASTIDPFKSCSCIPGRGSCLIDSHPSGCVCKEPFDGPRCEMTSRSFKWPHGGYAIMPLRPGPTACNSGSFHLEMLANQTRDNAMVLFLGPTWLLPQSSQCPFLLLEIVDGRPRLTIDLCSFSSRNPTIFSLPNVGEAVGSGKWFRLDVTWTGATFSMTSPDCPSACSVTQTVPGTSRLLAGTRVVLLGGKPAASTRLLSDIPILRRSNSVNFYGCLRNLWINNELYDLWLDDEEATRGNTSPGCVSTCTSSISRSNAISSDIALSSTPSTPAKCSSPTGQCASAPSRPFYCRCKPGHAGDLCDKDPLPYSFGEKSYVQWEMVPTPRLKASSLFLEMQVSFRSRDSDGILLWLDSAQVLTQQSMSRRRLDEPDHIALMLASSRIAARIQLPPMKTEAKTFTSTSSPVVTDGDWHTAHLAIDFNSCHLRLKLDHGEGQLNNMYWRLPDVVCGWVKFGPVFLLGPSGYWFAGGRPDALGFHDLQLDNACLQDARLNGYTLPLSAAEGSSDIGRVVDSSGTVGGCYSTPLRPAPQDCASVSCPPLSQCVTEWRQISCLCPSGLVPMIYEKTLSECPSFIGASSSICDWSPEIAPADPPCVYGVCKNLYSNGSRCQCFNGYSGARCLPLGSGTVQTPERSRSGHDSLQIAAIVIPIVVGLCLLVILIWFICAVSSKRRAQAKAAALGINGPGNLSSVSEAELLADAVLGQSTAPVDNDAAGEEDVDLSSYDLSRLQTAILEKQRASQRHLLNGGNQSLMAMAPNGVGQTRGPIIMPPSYTTVVGDLDRVLAARLAAADIALEQPSALTGTRPGLQGTRGGSTDDDLSMTGTDDADNDAAETNLDLSFLTKLGGPYSTLTKQIGVDSN